MARKNEGKQFEDNWKSSIPENVLYYRLKDSAQSFGFKNNENTNLRFSLKNPCDCFLFCSPYFFTIELKSTVSTSISFEREKNQKNKKMIHYHQINGLNKFSKYNFVISGFLFNFDNTREYVHQLACDLLQPNDEFDTVKNRFIPLHPPLLQKCHLTKRI